MDPWSAKEISRSMLRTYYLEMRDPAELRAKAAPAGFEVVPIRPPSPAVNSRFYRDVGTRWQWTDRLTWNAEDWQRYVQRDSLETWVGFLAGCEAGFFELESDLEGNTQLVYFGLLPEFVGRGLGGPLLTAAIRRGWAIPGTRRLWVHTCTKDHPHALPNYRKRGFRQYKIETG